MLDSDAQSMLTDLQWHWEDAYKITCRDGVWLAVPLADPFVTISRDSSGEHARRSGWTTQNEAAGVRQATAAPDAR